MPSSSDLSPDSAGQSAGGPGSVDPARPIGADDADYETSGPYESDDGIYDEDPEDSSGGAWRLSRLNMGLLCLSVASLSAALYISPAGSDVREKVQQVLPGSTIAKAVTPPGAISTPSATATGRVTPGSGATSAPGGTATSGADALGSGTPARGSTSSTGSTSGTGSISGTGGSGPVSGVSALSPLTTGGYQYQGSGNGSGNGSGGGSGGSGGGSGSNPTPPSPDAPASTPKPSTPKPTPNPPTPAAAAQQLTKCYQFRWQQDAQRVYMQNLSDPHGLDGDPGPHDGDGLACTHLPVDATRAASTPAGAYTPPKPSVAAKKVLVNPDKDYFGFMQDGVPGDTAMVEELAGRAGKAPSTIGWFAKFDSPYRADLVRSSWSRGALPVITWMPTDRSLTSIIEGTHDRYLRRYAGDVAREGLPVSLRFAHEMNGSWYGWSAGRTEYNNSPAKYIAAWRHIWQVFDDVGATDDVIWLWSPGRVDNLTPRAGNGLTTLAEDYPGDAYVDWIGATVYLRYANVGPSYEASFGKTVAALRDVTDKPIFFGETGAVQTDVGADQTALKVAWMQNVLAQFAKDDNIVGFLWFNNVAATVVNGVETTNDWRFDATEATTAAFRRAVEDPAFAEGVPLD